MSEGKPIGPVPQPDMAKELERSLASAPRPTARLPQATWPQKPPQQGGEAPLLFDSLQEAAAALGQAQERLDRLGQRLLRDIPSFHPVERSGGEGGLLVSAGKTARNMRARAEHMVRVIEMLEEGLG